jgi:hypothetical protein
VERFGGVIGAEIRAVAEDGAVIHQAAFAEEILALLNIGGGKQDHSAGTGNAVRNGCAAAIHHHAAHDHDGESEKQSKKKAVLPKARFLLNAGTHDSRLKRPVPLGYD